MKKNVCKKCRNEYFKLMKLEKDKDKSKKVSEKDHDKCKEAFERDHNKCKEAFEKAHEIRRFEINLYWERNKYMYVIVGAIFLGAFKDVEGAKTMPLFLSFVGMIVTFAWVLINKGSKFWIQNWDSHVEMLEDEITGDLYKVNNIKDIRENGWSVSRVNIYLSIFIFYCFSFLFIYHFFHLIPLKNFTEILSGLFKWDYWQKYMLFAFGVVAIFVWLLFIINVWSASKVKIFLCIFSLLLIYYFFHLVTLKDFTQILSEPLELVFGVVALFVLLLLIINVWKCKKPHKCCIMKLDCLRSEIPTGEDYDKHKDCLHIFSKRERDYAIINKKK